MSEDAEVRLSPADWVARQAREYEESGGTEERHPRLPCLLLDYSGRRTGEWRRTVLIYGPGRRRLPDRRLQGRPPRHPLWYHSLVANPEVHLRVLGERFPARAGCSPEDKARVWPHLLEVYAPYGDYQKGRPRHPGHPPLPHLTPRPTTRSAAAGRALAGRNTAAGAAGPA